MRKTFKAEDSNNVYIYIYNIRNLKTYMKINTIFYKVKDLSELKQNCFRSKILIHIAKIKRLRKMF